MITLIKNKQSAYCIAIPQNASNVEKTVAGELAEYVDKVYDVLLPVVSESSVSGKAFYVGHTEYAKNNGFTADSCENWMICVHNENVILHGGLTNTDRGVGYAVYHFLEDIVGVRWWTWFEEYVPNEDTLELADDFASSGTPVFEYRNVIDTFQPVNYEYILRNRMNAWSDITNIEQIAHKDFVNRGGVKYFGPPHPSHTIPRLVLIDELYDEHPDWFAYNALLGYRPKTPQHGTNYCHTNEGLIRYVADKVIANIDENIKRSKELGIEPASFFSVSVADSQGHCQCEKCAPLHEKAGRSGYNLYLANEVAKLVAEKHPEVLIHTLIYWDYIEPPKDDTVPEPNILVHFADLKADLMRDIHHPVNKDCLRLLDTWSKACEKNNSTMYIWDYFLQEYPNTSMPYFLKLAHNFRYFHEKGGKGCFIEHEISHVSDFFSMTQWLLARVMEDPYQDYEALKEDFIVRYYGDAAPQVRQYIKLLEQNLADNGCRTMVFEQAVLGNYMNYVTVRDGIKILSEAEQAVANDETRLKRIRLLQSCLYRTYALRYDDFEKIAASRGETLPISKEDAANLVIEYVKVNVEVYGNEKYPEHTESIAKRIEEEIHHMKRLVIKPKPVVPVPEELKQFGEENIYTVSGVGFHSMAGCGMLPDGKPVGEYMEVDDEVGREVFRIAPDEMHPKRKLMYISSPKDAELPNPVVFFTEGDNENFHTELFFEDLVPDEYHLYHLGDISNVSAQTSTMFRLLHYIGYSLGISHLYEVIPSDKYGIYINMKVTGPDYGGNENDPNGLYIDAVHIVKK
ncbi:MAG: DUF4838 domain-containing protein [Clostridia bacterium]|nr:DUF4838 domain-containing protein [Clostridia bacterium]